MAFEVNDQFQVNVAIPLDSRMVKADVAARDAIPAGVRFLGMEVYVVAELKKYTLKTGLTDADWEEAGGGGTDLGDADAPRSGYSQRFGVMWSSANLDDTIDQILQLTYAGPLISLGSSPSTALREKGTVVNSVTLTANTTKRSNNISQVRFYRGGVLVNTVGSPNVNGGTESYTNNTAFSDDMSFYADVTDVAGGGGPTTSNSNTINYSFVYPYYSGTGLPARTAAQVATMTKLVVGSTSNYNRPFTPSNGDVYYFAYPASYGALTSILDANNFESISDWTLRTENITGLDGVPVSYRIYEFKNPVVAGSTSYTFKR